ncbi:EF-hand domain-containing protein 1 [Cyclospora cayetanensis]|uniref:EF-hand domain-containing protein 1 n=1 Tax=Cyclospora cayetanensis TaxID=88456 RepID=A0A6P6RPV3_9EIME|nr:EF-hand domain-containing protein 1 [Cyclospora cayetanensis]
MRLQLGADLELYGRVFRVVECDEFTRWFCFNAGHDVGEAELLPDDPFFRSAVMSRRNTTSRPATLQIKIKPARALAEASLGSSCNNKSLLQYLQNDRYVLVFSCYWDNQENFGCRTYYDLHYFLSDDTAEIKVKPIKNSGCASYATFLRRGRLPKTLQEPTWSDYKHRRSDCYVPEDLIVGKNIEVYGRSFHLYDCDEFTRQFYREFLSIEQSKETIEDEKFEEPPINWPCHSLGIGTDEDTIQSCLRITPKRPHPRERELLFGDDITLNFKAILVSNFEEDKDREFRISIRHLTDKITVFEYAKRNSGHAGGKFLEANSLPNPLTGRNCSACDFFVGAEVILNGYKFRITEADERTLQAESGDLIDVDFLKEKLSGLLTEHEILTVIRTGAATQELTEGQEEGKKCHSGARHNRRESVVFARAQSLLCANHHVGWNYEGAADSPVGGSLALGGILSNTRRCRLFYEDVT